MYAHMLFDDSLAIVSAPPYRRCSCHTNKNIWRQKNAVEPVKYSESFTNLSAIHPASPVAPFSVICWPRTARFEPLQAKRFMMKRGFDVCIITIHSDERCASGVGRVIKSMNILSNFSRFNSSGTCTSCSPSPGWLPGSHASVLPYPAPCE
jgi:hypothetical protein